MRTLEHRRERLIRAFPADQADLLAEVITEAYDDLVKVSDFTELKVIVADLAGAQKRTEQGLEDLRVTVAELAEAQKRTERAVEALAEAITETRRDLTAAITETRRDLTAAIGDTRRDLGGLSQSMGYAMENEAYRMLPPLLEERFGISLTRRLLRTQIGDEEINLFGEGTRNGSSVVVVGEAKVRLDARWRRDDPTIFEDLQEKVEAVKQAHPDAEAVPLIVAHFAKPAFIAEARKRGVAVIQSFEW